MLKTDNVCNLAAALARMGGNVKLLRAAIEFYREDGPLILANLRAALSADDAAKVQLAAHSLKGLLVNFDAELAAQAAFDVERLAEARDLTAAPAAAERLQQEVDRLTPSLEQEIARLESSSAR